MTAAKALITIILFLAGTYLTGIFFHHHLRDHGKGIQDRPCMYFALGSGINIALISFIAEILAYLGSYYFWLLIIIYSVLILICLLCVSKFNIRIDPKKLFICGEKSDPQIKKEFLIQSGGIRADWILLVMLICLVFLYTHFASTYMKAGRDYGIYLINAVNINRTHTCQIPTDTLLDDIYGELDRVINISPVYPAFFSSHLSGLSDSVGDINEQFLMLFSCILAVGYSIGGIWLLVRIPGLITGAAVWIFYYLIVTLTGNRRSALFGTLVFGLCPAILWGGRITQSEQMALLFALMTFLLWYLGIHGKSGLMIHLSAAACGMMCLCRIDSYLTGMGFMAACIYTALAGNDKEKDRKLSGIVYTAGLHFVVWSFLSLWAVQEYHYKYYMDHRYLIMPLIYCICLEGIALSGAYILTTGLRNRRAEAVLARMAELAPFVSCVLFSVFLVIAWFRNIEDHGELVSNLRQYTWYYSQIMLALAVPGVFRLFCAQNSKKIFLPDWKHGTGILYCDRIMILISGIISVMLYTVRPSVYMDHFWMSRRWVPANFPFMILAGTAGLTAIAEILSGKVFSFGIEKTVNEKRKSALHRCTRVLKLIPWLIGVAVLAYILRQDRFFILRTSYGGMEEQFRRFVSVLPEDAIILTDGYQTTSILKYVYGLDAYQTVGEPDLSQIRDFNEKSSRKLFYIGTSNHRYSPWSVRKTYIPEGNIETLAPEGIYDSYPRKFVSDRTQAYRLDILDVPATICDALDDMYLVERDEHDVRDDHRIIPAICPNIIYGPYYTLEAGEYEVRWLYENSGDLRADFSITADEGRQVLEITDEGHQIPASHIMWQEILSDDMDASERIYISDILQEVPDLKSTSLTFSIGETTGGLEFPVNLQNASGFSLRSVLLRKMR